MKSLSSVGFLVGGVAIGILLGKGPMSSATKSPDAEVVSANARSNRSERVSTPNSSSSDLNAIRQAAPDKLPGLTQQSVTTADPIEMQRLFAECLLHMSAANWRDVVASFNQISSTTGRDPGDEWKLALFRSGQVAGAEAMDSYLAGGLKNRGTQAWQTLYGWGSKDPRAAIAWLKKAEAEGHETSNEHYSAVIAGTALSNPQDALKLLDEIPPAQRKDCAGNLVWNVVQNGGTDALDPVLRYASKLDASDASNAELANDLFQEATEKLLWKADHARDVPQACEVVSKVSQYGRDPNELTDTVLRKYRYYFMPDKLNILEAMSAGPRGSELRLASLASRVMSTMNGEGDRTAVREWMSQHPDSALIPHLTKRMQPE